MPTNKETQYHAWYWIAAMVAVMTIQVIFASYTQIAQIPYSEFQNDLKAGKITEVRVSGNYIQGKLTVPDQQGRSEFITTRVDTEIAQELEKYNVKFAGAIESTFLRDLLSWVVPVALFAGVWMFMYRRFASQQGFGGLMSVGRSKAKVYVETDTKTTFADVAGVDEANVPFFSINGSEFVEMFVGVGAARVRDLFEQAHQKAPCIIFIDELDALGRARAASPYGGGHDEKEQTLNQLLSELDGFDTRVGMVLLAATNRPEILDPALLRAGRFDRQVLVDRPDKIGRVQILEVHSRKIRMATNVDLETVAALTPGFTGADLANLVNEAALLATRRGADAVTLDDFTAAMERIVAGLEKKNRLLNPHEREVVAHHEMGHALVALSLPGTDRVHKVSIIPRGIGSLGYTIQRPTEDRFLMTRQELENKMAVLLGGRASETIIFGELSTGASDDLAKVSDIARSLVTRYGMTDELGLVVYEKSPQSFLGGEPPQTPFERSYSEATAREIDGAVKAIVDAAFRRTVTLLREKRDILERGAHLLLERETLDEADLAALLAKEPAVAG